jgi:diaminopropionate ammonia-lyase
LFFANPHKQQTLPDAMPDAFDREQTEAVVRFIHSFPGYARTPLVALPGLAAELGLGALHIKNEADRFGLKSFKALGGSYAVVRIVMDKAEIAFGRNFGPEDLQSLELHMFAADLTVACATDGNHGRSVAVGARLLGCRCVIFLHEGVSAAREQAIRNEGADIVRVAGRYDDAVAESIAQCERNGWILVSDTSWPGYEKTPLKVMQGYTVMLDEALADMPHPPTHVFLQAGVGGLAASVAATLLHRLGDSFPKIVIVEPETAACLLAAAQHDAVVAVDEQAPTLMAMLECFKASAVAWAILRPLADGFVTVGDDAAAQAMRRFARAGEGDLPIVSGESGSAGLAGLDACLKDSAAKDALGLDEHSRVLLFNTEGATDPESYRQIVGKTPEEVAGNG